MVVSDDLLFQFFQHVSPLQLLQLYAVSDRFRAIIRYLFQSRNRLHVPRSLTTTSLYHKGWQYLAPHSLQKVAHLPDASRTILYKNSGDSLASIQVLYPYRVVVYYQTTAFRGSLSPRRVLYQRGKLTHVRLPGSKSGHAGQQQIKIVNSTELEEDSPACGNSLFILQSADKTCIYLFPYASSSTLYQACIPPVSQPQDWIDALCKDFVARGITGPCLFLCDQTPVACRLLLSVGDCLPLRIRIHHMSVCSPQPLSTTFHSTTTTQHCRITSTHHTHEPLTIESPS